MKKFFSFFLCAVLSMTAASFFTSCGSDDDDEPKIPLSVSPSNITLQSDRSASTTFVINCTGTWTLQNNSDWLMTSASSGSGTTNITITALSANDTSSPRHAQISVFCDGETSTVEVTQLAEYSNECSVTFSDPYVMNNSVAFTYNIGSEVSYFYAGFLSASAIAWTEDRIVNELANSDRFDPQDTDITGTTGFGGMDPNTTYYLCAIAYDAKGNRGELTKTKITTLKENVNDPWVDFTGVSYTSTSWYLSLHKNPFAHQYYLVCYDGINALGMYYLFTDAEIAVLMNNLINQNLIFPFTNDSDELPYNRTANATDVYFACWAQSGKFEFSPQLNTGLWSIDSSDRPERKIGERRDVRRIHFTPAAEMEKLASSLKIRKI